MTERKVIGEKAENFFEELWKRGDPWQLETSSFEHAKYERQIAMLGTHHYERVLEIGCGAGSFTRRLKTVADYILALDVAPAAISRATQRGNDGIDYRVANVMEFDFRVNQPWDLIVISETIYYLGWLYPFFDVAWLANEIFEASDTDGRLLVSNTQRGVDDFLLRPWLVRTYRDLFFNVGFVPEIEEIFVGAKNGVEIEVLMTLFTKKLAR
jgi:ubiquinone/menaquinone biosynthesis C-methylase UbiE